MLLISALLLQRFCMIGYLNAMLDHLQKKKEEHSKNTQQRSHVTRLTVEICSISIIYTSESEISEISAKDISFMGINLFKILLCNSIYDSPEILQNYEF